MYIWMGYKFCLPKKVCGTFVLGRNARQDLGFVVWTSFLFRARAVVRSCFESVWLCRRIRGQGVGEGLRDRQRL
jgi:hypothetical protein